MWIILKYNKNSLNTLRHELIKKTDSNLKVYFPKISINPKKKLKILEKK